MDQLSSRATFQKLLPTSSYTTSCVVRLLCSWVVELTFKFTHMPHTCILSHTHTLTHTHTHTHTRVCTALLGITPSPNNGTVGSLYHILNSSLLPTLPPPQTFHGTPGIRKNCSYPIDEATYNTRTFCNVCVCWHDDLCPLYDNASINASNPLLNQTFQQSEFCSKCSRLCMIFSYWTSCNIIYK